MTTMEEKTHCAWCLRGMGTKNIGKGIGPECKSKLPDTINVALCNRSEHGHHDVYSHAENDAENAFKHFGDSVDIIIFASSSIGIIEDFFDEETTWDIYYKTEEGIIPIESVVQYESDRPEVSGKAAKYRRRVAVMCDPRTKTKVNLVWIDSQLGFLMNRGHYNGPYPVGMDIEEWAKEIYGQEAHEIPQCMACCVAQMRHEELTILEEEIEDRMDKYVHFTNRFPELRSNILHRVLSNEVNIYRSRQKQLEDIMNDITLDPMNEGGQPFIGHPMQYDWSEGYEHFSDTNIVKAGELEWLTEYGSRVFEYCLLPYLLKDLAKAYDDNWEPLDEWESTNVGYMNWTTEFWRHGPEKKKDAILDALCMTMYDLYPIAYSNLKLTNGKTCEENALN